MGDALRCFAAVTGKLVIWDEAESGLAFLKAKSLPRDTVLFELEPADYAELNRHGWVGVAAETIARRGHRVTFEIVKVTA